MRIIILFYLICVSNNLFGQSLKFDVDWNGVEEYFIGKKSLIIPNSKNFKNNYSYSGYYKIVNQWQDDKIIDQSSVIISNIQYSNLNIEEFPGLKEIDFQEKVEFNLNSSISKNKIFSFLEITPIILQNGVYKKIESFDIDYKYSTKSKVNRSLTEPSVMRNGEWFQFFVHQTGIHKIDKDFLEDLGVDTDNINPKKIKIYGHGGGMLTMENLDNFLIDPVENSIKVVGEEDGVFNSDDYILFYASGPEGFNTQSNTNLNLYENKISYFLSVGSDDGLRISNLIEPNDDSALTIDFYTNYKFYENDDYNLAKIGRRWFGDRFDFENVKNFQFDIDDLILEHPVKLKITAAATSEIITTMSVDVNSSQLTTMVFGPIGDPILATGDSFSSNINLNSSTANIKLTYNNNGNPASSGYLDYISIEGRSNLNFNNGQLIFYNSDIDDDYNIVNYEITNAQNVISIWNISDTSNVTEISPNQANTFSFKSIAVTFAPIFIALLIELFPTSPQPMTVTLEFFLSEIEDTKTPFPPDEYSRNCIPFCIAMFPAIFDIGTNKGYMLLSIIISVAIPVSFFSSSFFVKSKFEARCK